MNILMIGAIALVVVIASAMCYHWDTIKKRFGGKKQSIKDEKTFEEYKEEVMQEGAVQSVVEQDDECISRGQ